MMKKGISWERMEVLSDCHSWEKLDELMEVSEMDYLERENEIEQEVENLDCRFSLGLCWKDFFLEIVLED